MRNEHGHGQRGTGSQRGRRARHRLAAKGQALDDLAVDRRKRVAQQVAERAGSVVVRGEPLQVVVAAAAGPLRDVLQHARAGVVGDRRPDVAVSERLDGGRADLHNARPVLHLRALPASEAHGQHVCCKPGTLLRRCH